MKKPFIPQLKTHTPPAEGLIPVPKPKTRGRRRTDPLESDIEKKVKGKAKKNFGYWVRKFSSPAHRSVPDDVFINKKGLHIYIEFKRLNEKPSGNQQDELDELDSRHALTRVIDNSPEGIWFLGLFAELDPRDYFVSPDHYRNLSNRESYNADCAARKVEGLPPPGTTRRR